MKTIELESLFGNNDILSLTETQQKMGKSTLATMSNMSRICEMSRQKGGGRMIL